jgi:methylamine utilization protein MauE
MSPNLQLLLQLVVGLTFLASTFGKVQAPALFLDGLRDYKMLANWGVHYAGLFVVASEGLIAFSFLSGWLVRPAGILALVLLTSFLVTTSLALIGGKQVKCLCFGARSTEPLSVRTLVRILLLATFVIVLLTQSPARDGWLGTAYSRHVILTALTCALLSYALISWVFDMPDLARLLKECRGCRRQTAKPDAGRNPIAATESQR